MIVEERVEKEADNNAIRAIAQAAKASDLSRRYANVNKAIKGPIKDSELISKVISMIHQASIDNKKDIQGLILLIINGKQVRRVATIASVVGVAKDAPRSRLMKSSGMSMLARRVSCKRPNPKAPAQITKSTSQSVALKRTSWNSILLIQERSFVLSAPSVIECNIWIGRL